MRRDEAFVAWALSEYLGGPDVARIVEGPDPPDFYLHLDGRQVGVEVTRLSQFTFEPDGSLGNRATQDNFALRLLDELDRDIGPLVDDAQSLLVGLWVPVGDPRRFKAQLTDLLSEVARDGREESDREARLGDARVTVRVISRRHSRSAIVGYVVNIHADANVELNAQTLLEDRITRKSAICAALQRPLWLALFNEYWIADADTYLRAARHVVCNHCFERIFLVSEQGAVTEMHVGAQQLCIQADH